MHAATVLIVGHGRSGSNFLLRLLDLSPLTHCRNEPNELDGSLFRRLPAGTTRLADTAALAAGWEDAVRWSAERMGERDPWPPDGKRHLFGASRRLGIERLVRGRRARRLMAALVPELRQSEWRLPRLLGSRRALSEATVVFKILLQPGWVEWILEARAARVLHIVRHPGGFLNSWRNRYLSRNDPRLVHQQNLARLRLAQADPAWTPLSDVDLDALSVEEAELWYWRYLTETMHAAGQRADGYRRILYDELAADPAGIMKGVHEFCALPWNPSIDAATRRSGSRSEDIAQAWRDKLPAADHALLERILAGSVMESWWDTPA